MKQIFVTKQGLGMLQARRDEYFERLRAVQGQKGEAAEVGGNVWHDNFAFEELVRQENMLSKQIQDVGDMLKIATMVPDQPADTRALQIGHVVSLYFEEDDAIKEYQVGGFGESNLDAQPPLIEYSAPLLAPFFGHEVGHEATVQLGGVSKHVHLEAIQLRGT